MNTRNHNGVLGEPKRLQAEIAEALSHMSIDDLWAVHKAVNEITYAANVAKYRKRGALLTASTKPVLVQKEATGGGASASGTGGGARG